MNEDIYDIKNKYDILMKQYLVMQVSKIELEVISDKAFYFINERITELKNSKELPTKELYIEILETLSKIIGGYDYKNL